MNLAAGIYLVSWLLPFTQRYLLSFSGCWFRNISKCDPMLVVYTNINGNLEEIGRTEVVSNSREPSWIAKSTMSYQFETLQPLIFRIYDVDSKYHKTPVKMLNLAGQNYLGEASCNLSDIVREFNRSLTLNLRSNCGNFVHGTMTVHAEESDSSRMAVEMTLRCMNLENKDAFSKSDPFLRISKLVEATGPIPICETEVVTDNLIPVWRPITLTSQEYGSKDNPLLVEWFDFYCTGNHELKGAFQTTITQLEILYTSKSGANFYSHKGQRKMKGQLFVDKMHEKVQHNFSDYVSIGMFAVTGAPVLRRGTSLPLRLARSIALRQAQPPPTLTPSPGELRRDWVEITAELNVEVHGGTSNEQMQLELSTPILDSMATLSTTATVTSLLQQPESAAVAVVVAGFLTALWERLVRAFSQRLPPSLRLAMEGQPLLPTSVAQIRVDMASSPWATCSRLLWLGASSLLRTLAAVGWFFIVALTMLLPSPTPQMRFKVNMSKAFSLMIAIFTALIDAVLHLINKLWCRLFGRRSSNESADS